MEFVRDQACNFFEEYLILNARPLPAALIS